MFETENFHLFASKNSANIAQCKILNLETKKLANKGAFDKLTN